MNGYNVMRWVFWIACLIISVLVGQVINLREHPRVVIINRCDMEQPPQPDPPRLRLIFPTSAWDKHRGTSTPTLPTKELGAP